jgi:cyanophycinase
VLIGGASGQWPTTGEIDRAAIEAIRRDGPIVFLPAANCPPDYGESFLDHYERLGAPGGRVAPINDVASARDPANADLLANASLVYIGGGDSQRLLATMTGSPALEALAAAYENGAVIAGASAGAIAIATWGVPVDTSIGLLEGWSWLRDAIVAPHYDAAERARALAAAIARQPQAVGVGLPDDAALALGPNGEVQEWGEAQIGFINGAKFEETPR